MKHVPQGGRKLLAVVPALLCLISCAWAAPTTRPTKPGREEAEKARRTLEKMFGQELRRAAATASRTDDVSLGRKLVAEAKRGPHDRALTTVLCEKAYSLTHRHADGHAAAVEAMQVLIGARPDKRAECLDKILAVRHRQFTMAKGAERGRVGRKLVADLIAAAQLKAEADEFGRATAMCRQALPIARTHEPDDVEKIQAKLTEYTRLAGVTRAIAGLKVRLASDPNDKAARQQLITLYVTERDRPDEAVKYLNNTAPVDFRTNVPLAAKRTDQLAKTSCMKLAQWYQQLAKTPTRTRKLITLNRAKGHYERFLSLHSTRDMLRVKATMGLEEVTKSLAGLGIKPKAKQTVPWQKVFAFTTRASRLVAKGKGAERLLRDREDMTVEMWLLPAEEDGIIFDQGTDSSGIAIALARGQLGLAVRTWAQQIRRVKTKGGRGKRTDKETERKGPKISFSRVLTTPLPSRRNWTHVAVVFAKGRISLWVNGVLKGSGTFSTSTLKGDLKSSIAIGGGDGPNAGQWPRQGFAGKIALVRISDQARYSDQFKPDMAMSSSGASAYIAGDRLNYGPVGKLGARGGPLLWKPDGNVAVIPSALIGGPPLEPERPGRTLPGLRYEHFTGRFNSCGEIAAKGKRAKAGTTGGFNLNAVQTKGPFGFIFTGYIDVPATGDYTFHTTSDDGSRLHIGPVLVVDNDGRHPPQTRSGRIALKAGKHRIMVAYFEHNRGGSLEVQYEGPNVTKKRIPAGILTHRVFIVRPPTKRQ